MATTTVTTGIQLGSLGADPHADAGSTITQRDPSSSQHPSLHGPDDGGGDDDPVLAASRLADSAVPDGGYGWVVVGACAVVTWWFVGTSYSWGIIEGALVDEGLSSPSTLAFVGSLSVAVMSSLAIINGRVARTLGARKTGMLGVGLLGLAEIMSGFSVNSVAALFATSGVVMGLGMSLCFMTVTATPAQYFSRKRGLANGVVFAGGGLGGAVTSFSLDSLIQRVGPAWTYRVLGLATLVTGLPAAWLIKERNRVRTAAFVDWHLFKDVGFLLVFFAGAVGTFPLFVPPFFLPLYSDTIGLSSSTGAGLVAGFNLASAVGRIASGILCDKVGSLNTLFLALMLTALSMLALWPASTTLAPLAAFVVINGAANGGFFSTMPTVVGNVFGSARVSVAMGMIVTGWAGGYLMGAPIAGYLLEAYGGQDNGLQAYRPAMFYAGSMALGAAGLVALMRFRMSRHVFAKF